jgi:tetratricopeptide (TPR) repeat protein
VGDDAKAKKYLEEAFYGDSYNVRTYNLLSVFYDKVIKEFDWLDVKPMRLRVHRSERDVLERYVPPLLTEAFTALEKKYGYTPSGPLHIEIFPDKELFSVRSTGLPRLGAHGICFGHVITSRSPSEGNFNWAEVLWHELSHVFHIQLSKSRVPRWFTEGLAVYESTEGRTQWRREMDPSLAEYLREGKLRGVADFNLSFTQARNLRDILVAYYHAFVVTDYIVQRFGFPKMRALLVAWGAKKTTSEAFQSVLGTSLADFDKAFTTWLQAHLAPLNRNFNIHPHRFAKDAKRLLEAAAKDPKDAKAGIDAAMAVYAGGKRDRALELAEQVLGQHPKHPRALLLRAKIRLRKKEFKSAGTDLEALLKQGLDGPEIRQALAFIATQAKKPAEAIEQLKRAIARSPKDASLFRALLTILDGEKKAREAYEWRKKLADIDQMSLKLVDTLLAAGPGYGATKAELLMWGEMGNHIAPFSVAHHVRFAEVLIGLGEKGKARFEVESALIVEPGNAQAKELLGKL